MGRIASVTIVTSIPPSLIRRERGRAVAGDYQALCIKSWKDNGFNIVSVNDASEVESLSAKYPDVTFRSVDRNSSAVSGKRTPFIVDMLAVALEEGSPVVGLCNSDILLEYRPDWLEQLPRLVANSAIIMQRLDTSSLDNGGMRPFINGFDVFFFERDAAKSLAQQNAPFAIGLPWWDYWLPLALARQGLRLKLLDRPSAIHLVHDQGYHWNVYRQLGKIFTTFAASVLNDGSAAPEFQLLATVCQQALQANPSTAEELDSWLSRISFEFIDGLQKAEACKWDVAGDRLESSESHHKAFDDLAARIKAGALLCRAWDLFGGGKTAEAEPLLRAVLEHMPDEFDALSLLGKIYLEEKQFSKAVEFLTKAAAQRDDIPALLDALASALIGAEAYAEAIPYLERALSLSPDFAQGHRHLAMALQALGRQADAQLLSRALD